MNQPQTDTASITALLGHKGYLGWRKLVRLAQIKKKRPIFIFEKALPKHLHLGIQSYISLCVLKFALLPVLNSGPLLAIWVPKAAKGINKGVIELYLTPNSCCGVNAML